MISLCTTTYSLPCLSSYCGALVELPASWLRQKTLLSLTSKCTASFDYKATSAGRPMLCTQFVYFVRGEEFRLMNRAVLKKMLTWLLPSDPTTEETLTLFTKCLFNQNKTFLIYDERDEIGQLIDLISDSCETSVCSISKSISFHITFGHAQKLKKLLSTIKEQDMDRG